MKNKIKFVLIFALILLFMSGCTEANRVNANINQAADNFTAALRCS